MFERPLIFAAAMSASLALLGLAESTHAAPAAPKYAVSRSHQSGYPAQQGDCQCSPLPRPGLQPDYQFYYDTPGYYPGFYPGAGMTREPGPLLGAGFSEGPVGNH